MVRQNRQIKLANIGLPEENHSLILREILERVFKDVVDTDIKQARAVQLLLKQAAQGHQNPSAKLCKTLPGGEDATHILK